MDEELQEDFTEQEEYANKTFYLDMENMRVVGSTDEENALRQFVLKCLATQSHDDDYYDVFGLYTDDLIGMDNLYIQSELAHRIEELLLEDDRIISIENIEFTKQEKDSLTVSIELETVYGDEYFEEVKVSV